MLHAKVLGAALAALAVLGGARAGSSTPGAYYLALGDSITYGLQPDKADAGLPPSAFRTGYVDVFAARLRKVTPGIRVVNYGCPGESTKTFVGGGCPWLAAGKRLHDPFPKTQQAAALAFLRAHPGRVSPITVTLWGNDLTEVTDVCGANLACLERRAPGAIAAFARRLGGILGRLRSAAPKAEIVVTGDWNIAVDNLAETQPLFQKLDRTMAEVAAGAGARYAALLPVFNAGSVAAQRARICAWTFTCSRDDPHPTDAGYRAIAAAVWAASGY